ncbi:hypothetical protein FHX74_000846 [Friedmanniella endophytica]|uniref:Glycosyl transferase family 2 n=1 Tax=Microlunatus kandeliicorticis TaxID=1759536 RepID=A0A7W3IQA0_9ACTN|nr:hypothetical protein [Microlunatus kandeliicorticis]MBA8793252.1 hypothetical protein [Microlunatus kandeliicorticis]
MRLRLLHRSYGGENRKNRPAYYSKLLCLASFIRAAEQVPDAEVLFLNDGPIPADRLRLMERAGEVVSLGDQPGGMRASYRFALDLPARRGWPADDVVSFNEDDYLFTEDAFLTLRNGAERLPQASYFALYAGEPDYDDPNSRRQFSLPRGWRPEPSVDFPGEHWWHHPSITSTFSARVGAVEADRGIFAQAMVPFRRRFLDHETCLLYQGVVPYHGFEYLIGLPDDFQPTLRGVVRTIVLIPFRVALNLRALTRRKDPHRLYAVGPTRASHLEDEVVSTDRDWPTVAREVVDWLRERGDEEAAATIEADLMSPSTPRREAG